MSVVPIESDGLGLEHRDVSRLKAFTVISWSFGQEAVETSFLCRSLPLHLVPPYHLQGHDPVGAEGLGQIVARPHVLLGYFGVCLGPRHHGLGVVWRDRVGA